MKKKKIKEIILHCSATQEGKDFKAADIDRWHKQLGWKMIGYNYVIDLDGTVELGRPIEMDGAHTVGHNKNSIGICYIGGLDMQGNPKDTRTMEQCMSLEVLLIMILREFDLTPDDIYGHYQFANKACPSFKIEPLRKRLWKLYEDK